MNMQARPLDWESEFLELLAKMDSAIHRQKNEQRKLKMVRYQTLFASGGWMGLRAKEMLNLSWHEVVGKTENSFFQFKQGKKRKIYFSKNFIDYMDRNYSIIAPTNIRYLILHKEGDPLAPVSSTQFNNELKKYANKFGLGTDQVSSHTFRKTFMQKLWVELGGDERAYLTVGKMMGYADKTQVMDYLGHTDRDIKEAIIKF